MPNIDWYLPLIRATFIILFSVLLTLNLAQAGNIRLSGSITCLEHGDKDLRRTARYVILLPKGMPPSAGLSNEDGYYELVIDPVYVEDRDIEITYLDADGISQPGSQRFISMRDILNSSIVQLDTVENDINCEKIEDSWPVQNKRLALIRKLPPDKYQVKASAETAIREVVTTTGLAVADAVLGAGVSVGNVKISNKNVITILPFDTIAPSTLYKNTFIDLAWLESSQNIGFNFTPMRNQNEAALWNPSSIMFSFKNQMSFKTNFDDHFMATANYKIDSQGFSLGVLKYHKSETRSALYGSEIVRGKVDEYDFLETVSLSKLIRNKIALSLSINYLSQSIEKPVAIKQSTDVTTANVSKSLYLKKDFYENYDLNISSTFLLGSKFFVGVSLINALNSKLHYEDGNNVGLRSFGIGVTYQSGRLNVGTEVKSREGQKMDAAIGINYVPFNDVVIFAGASNALDARSVGLSYKKFSYSYNHSKLDSGYHLISVRVTF